MSTKPMLNAVSLPYICIREIVRSGHHWRKTSDLQLRTKYWNYWPSNERCEGTLDRVNCRHPVSKFSLRRHSNRELPITKQQCNHMIIKADHTRLCHWSVERVHRDSHSATNWTFVLRVPSDFSACWHLHTVSGAHSVPIQENTFLRVQAARAGGRPQLHLVPGVESVELNLHEAPHCAFTDKGTCRFCMI
jgi:hypothetical protein